MVMDPEANGKGATRQNGIHAEMREKVWDTVYLWGGTAKGLFRYETANQTDGRLH